MGGREKIAAGDAKWNKMQDDTIPSYVSSVITTIVEEEEENKELNHVSSKGKLKSNLKTKTSAGDATGSITTKSSLKRNTDSKNDKLPNLGRASTRATLTTKTSTRRTKTGIHVDRKLSNNRKNGLSRNSSHGKSSNGIVKKKSDNSMGVQSRKSFVREFVRREGQLFGGGEKGHRKEASGVVQVVQKGRNFFIRLRNISSGNNHDSGLHLYLTSFNATYEMPLIDRKGLLLDVPNVKDGQYRNEQELIDTLDISLDRLHTIVDPLTWSGLAFVKHKEDWPATDRPITFAFANFKNVEQDLSSLSDAIKSRREIFKKFESKKENLKVWGKGKTFLEIRKEIKPLLKYFDKDKSGDVDLTEFKDIVENIGLQISEARADKLFKAYDPSKKGAVDMDELPVALYTNSMLSTRTYTSPKDIFELYDRENVGTLDEVEFYEAIHILITEDISVKASRHLFRKVGAEKAGCMDFNQFLQAWGKKCNLDAELFRRKLDSQGQPMKGHAAGRNKVDDGGNESVAEGVDSSIGADSENNQDKKPDKDSKQKETKLRVESEKKGTENDKSVHKPKVGFLRNMLGIGGNVRKRAILIEFEQNQAIFEHEEFETARLKARSESVKLRQAIDTKKRELRAQRQKEALQAKKEKSKADRVSRQKREAEIIEQDRLKKREDVIREQMDKEIRARMERERQAKAEARVWREKQAKESRARLGDDRITISGESLRSVPESVFRGKIAQGVLSNLVLLNLSNNKLENLPRNGLFFWCASLRKLDLSHNRLTGTLSPEIESMGVLEVLNLYNNNLEYLPDEIRHLKSLRVMNIAENKLTDLPDAIEGLTSLHSLVAYHNQLISVPPAIQYMCKLTKLDLALNNLTSLPEEVAGLESLTSLNVSWNKLNKFPRAIGRLQNLEVLEMSSNRMRRLPDTLQGLLSLQVLNIRSNDLIEIPKSISGLKNLLELDASYNRVQRIPSAIGSLKSLQSVDLSHNQIKEIPAELGYLGRLVKLDFRDNLLNEIPPEIGALSSLQTLDISRNHVQGRLPKQIGALFNLVFCDLSFNQIHGLPSSIGGLNSLTTFSVRNNCLPGVPSELGLLRSLKHLNLAGNQIKALPLGLCQGGKLLQSIDISSNQLRQLPGEMADLPCLRHLKVHHNLLESIPPAFGRLIPKLETFQVTHNPFGDLPQKWNKDWGLSEQANLSWSNGYTDADIGTWAIERVEYFEVAVTIFEESRESYAKSHAGYNLERFIKAVQQTMGPEAFKAHYERQLVQFFFNARRLGCAPRYQLCTTEEQARIEKVKEQNLSFRNEMAQWAKDKHEEEDERLSIVYRASRHMLFSTQERLEQRKIDIQAARWADEQNDLIGKVNVLRVRQDAICEARETLRREEVKRKREEWTRNFNKERRKELSRQRDERKNKNLGVPLPKFVKSRLSSTPL